MKKFTGIGNIGAGNKFIIGGRIGYVIKNTSNCVRVAFAGKRQNLEYMNFVQISN